MKDFTKGKITDVVQAGQISNSRMLVVNAVSFEAEWKEEFWDGATEGRTFYVEPGVESQVWKLFQSLPLAYEEFH